MITNEDLLKEIDDMVLSAEQKMMEIDGRWITVCRGQVCRDSSGKRVGSPTVIILAGRKKVKSERAKGDPDSRMFTHYIDKKYYLGIMMTREFEKMFLTTIKPNRYIYIKIKFSQGKNRKPKERKN